MRLIIELLETRFKVLQFFWRSRDPKMYQKLSKMSCKTLLVMMLKIENNMFMFIALFPFMYQILWLKTTLNLVYTWLNMLEKHYYMLMKLKELKAYLNVFQNFQNSFKNQAFFQTSCLFPWSFLLCLASPLPHVFLPLLALHCCSRKWSRKKQ